MSAKRDKVFVDTGAWIALAVTTDPYHVRARSVWADLVADGARLVTSIPVVLETFTFLDRNTKRAVATTWRDQITALPRLQIAECTLADLTKSQVWFEQRSLVRVSAVDATSFTLMRRLKIRTAFAFDHHFAQAGFRLLG